MARRHNGAAGQDQTARALRSPTSTAKNSQRLRTIVVGTLRVPFSLAKPTPRSPGTAHGVCLLLALPHDQHQSRISPGGELLRPVLARLQTTAQLQRITYKRINAVHGLAL